MRQYERYLLRHLLWPTVITTASLTAIVWLTQVLKFLDFMLSRGLSLGDFFFLTGLMLPSLLLILLPIACAIAVMYTYNRLMAESELVVLTAVGVSKWQLARPALWMGAACAGLCYVLSLLLMPMANAKFQDIRTFFRDKYASVLLEEGVFNNPMDGVTVFVRTRDAEDNLAGLLIHDSRNADGAVTLLAERGRLEQGESGPRFHLQQGLRQQWREGRVGWLSFDDYTLDIAFYGQDVARKRNPTERTIGELFTREGLNEKEVLAYRAEAHQRLTWPLWALALPLLVLFMLFSSEFNRRGQGRRLLVASVSMALLVMAYFACHSMSSRHGFMVVGMYVLVLAPAVLAVSGLRGSGRARPAMQVAPPAWAGA